MKKGSKALLVLACAGCLVLGTVFGTLAYLTDDDAVTNTFTVGNVEIELDEEVVDEYGVAQNERTQKGNNYKLIPGHTYVKDPTVTVKKGSEKSYVRMIVTITDAKDVWEVLGNDFLPQNHVSGWDSSTWISKSAEQNQNNELVYEFWYKDIVDALDKEEKLPALFTEFTFPDYVTKENLVKLDGLAIHVEAHAIQADGFDTPEAAWVNFTK